MIRQLLALLLTLVSTGTLHAGQRFAVAVTETPVLNRPDFATVFGGADGQTLLTDPCGQLRAVEFVALPGTVFTVEQQLSDRGRPVYRVTTADYPYPATSGYYIAARSVRLTAERPPERSRRLPPREAILAALEQRVGSRYVWGGNVATGVADLDAWYPPTGPVDRSLWRLAGLDCSGLLYEATNGVTPRNTSALVTHGKAVKIAGKNAADIAAQLQPLDLVVWPGHVLIVLDRGRIIESRLVCANPTEGVRIRPLQAALAEIMKKRAPVDVIARKSEEFVVRRWYGETEQRVKAAGK